METRVAENQKDTVASETDNDLINREFIEKPDDEVLLLASHLARPDGFVKILICGQIATSEELVNKIAPEFVRTNRGYYRSSPPRPGESTNNYLSFQIGLAQRLYAESGILFDDKEWRKGLGFVMSAKELLSSGNSEVSYGHLGLKYILERIKKEGPKSKIEEKILNLPEGQLYFYDLKPPKEDLLDLVHLARKAGNLNEKSEQVEVNIHPTDEYPRASLTDCIILIPQKSKDALARLIDLKLKESLPYAAEIKKAFNVDITQLSAAHVLQQYKNIYWYPQNNIGQAVKFLSTHPDRVLDILLP